MPELAAALDELAGARRLLVALDFDGVLAPIVDDPCTSRTLPASARALEALATIDGTTVALVSGRALADLAALSGFTTPIRLVGSHGGEFDDGAAVLDDEQQARLDRLFAEVGSIVDGQDGVVVEHKPAGMAVHVRAATRETGARVLDALQAGPAAAGGIVATPGKEVLDLAVLEVDKGMAIDRLRAEVEADAVLFVGDDVTDESGFARLGAGDVGVKVGAGESTARFRVADPAEVSDLLGRLLAARSRSLRPKTDR
jgi:trehalose 6-phosphate phosphatase